MISKSKINNIVKKIIINYKPDKIILFGSYADDSANENSDIDLLIIKDSDISRPERGFEVRKYLYGSGIPIDIIVYTNKEIKESIDNKYSLIYKVINSGKILYERPN